MLIKGHYPQLFRLCMLGIVVVMFTVMTGCVRQSDGLAPTWGVPQSQEKPLRLLNDSAKTLYNYAKDGEFEEARIELDRLSDLLTTVSYKGITTLEGVNALTQTVVNARRIYNRVQLREKDALTAATQLRLITDALTHHNNPMWLEYEHVLKQDAEKLYGMVKSNNDVGSLAALQKLHYHYAIIHPTVIITKDASLVEKVDSLFNFLTVELSRGKVDYSRVNQGMNHLPVILNELFGSKDSQTSVPLAIQQNNVIWTTFIASVIISALAYVAWRRYRVL
ncbi:MAG: sporulation protein YpjB [Paenibacillaceae bacterium]